MIHYPTPHALGNHARDLRDGFCAESKAACLRGRASSYWNPKYCAIGWHDNKVLLADDNGSLEYTFRADGQISRRTYGCYGKLVEFVDLDVSRYVTAHNEALRAESKGVI